MVTLDNHKKAVRIDASCHADGSASLTFRELSTEVKIQFAQPVDLLNLAADLLRMARFGYSGQGEVSIPRDIDALLAQKPLVGIPVEDTILFGTLDTPA